MYIVLSTSSFSPGTSLLIRQNRIIKKQKMAARFSLILLLGLFVGLEGRSIVSSSPNEAVSNEKKMSGDSRWEFSKFRSTPIVRVADFTKNLTNLDDEIVETKDRLETDVFPRFVATQGLNLDKILAEFTARTADLKDYEDRTAQWLKLLKEMLQSSSSVKNFVKPNTVDETRTFLNNDDRKRLPIAGYNWLEELFEFLDEQDIDGHSIDENQSHVKSRYENSSTLFPLIDEKTEETEDTAEREGFEQLDKMLVNVESQLQQFRKYFEEICSKHRPMPSMKWQNRDHNGGRVSNNVQDQ